MSVYVDAIQEYPLDLINAEAQRYGTRWCHMTADTPRELLDMARKLNLSAAHVQHGGIGKRIMHFDLVPSKRTQAIRLGAKVVTTAEMIARFDAAHPRKSAPPRHISLTALRPIPPGWHERNRRPMVARRGRVYDAPAVPAWVETREANKEAVLFKDNLMTYEQAIELSLSSLRYYGDQYPVWLLSFSGGKDSSATLAFVLWAIQSGQVKAPEKLVLLYADTRMELPPLAITAYKVMDEIRQRGYEAHAVLPRYTKRFWVQMLGRGVPPPKNQMRWCTRIMKKEPMEHAAAKLKKQYGEDKILWLTGVRMGESKARDNRIILSCSKNDGECGQGWFQQQKHALAPLMHWRVCWVWKWIYDQRNPLPIVRDIESVYAADDLVDIRTGCIACNLVETDHALHSLVRKPKFKHLQPLTELRGMYDQMYSPAHRLRLGDYVKADGTYSGHLTNALGPLTIEARQYFFDRVKDIEKRSGYQLINAAEEKLIRRMWRWKVYPQGWTGDEKPAQQAPLRKTLVLKSGELIGHQETYMDEPRTQQPHPAAGEGAGHEQSTREVEV